VFLESGILWRLGRIFTNAWVEAKIIISYEIIFGNSLVISDESLLLMEY
jgi:hypothetical protein